VYRTLERNVCSIPKTSVSFYQTTLRKIIEDSHLHRSGASSKTESLQSPEEKNLHSESTGIQVSRDFANLLGSHRVIKFESHLVEIQRNNCTSLYRSDLRSNTVQKIWCCEIFGGFSQSFLPNAGTIHRSFSNPSRSQFIISIDTS
jgi:hypothetical protein